MSVQGIFTMITLCRAACLSTTIDIQVEMEIGVELKQHSHRDQLQLQDLEELPLTAILNIQEAMLQAQKVPGTQESLGNLVDCTVQWEQEDQVFQMIMISREDLDILGLQDIQEDQEIHPDLDIQEIEVDLAILADQIILRKTIYPEVPKDLGIRGI